MFLFHVRSEKVSVLISYQAFLCSCDIHTMTTSVYLVKYCEHYLSTVYVFFGRLDLEVETIKRELGSSKTQWAIVTPEVLRSTE